MDVYQRLGLKPIINCAATYTKLGGPNGTTRRATNTFYDGWGRQIETQEISPTAGRRLVTSTGSGSPETDTSSSATLARSSSSGSWTAGSVTGASLLNLALIVAVFVPIIIASQVNKRLSKQLQRPVSSGVVWLAGIVGAIAVALLVNLGGAYRTLLNSGDFVGVILQTVLYVAIRVPLTLVLAMVLALVLNSDFIKGRAFFRVLLFVPWAASSLSILIALIWQFFFREQGTINQFLNAVFGFKGPAWLNLEWGAMASIVIADVWFSYPFMMIIILGALQSIPGEQYEAAEIDGATWMQQFNAITLPLLRPAILPAIVLTSISAFQMFGTAYAMTAGGPIKGAGQPGFTEFVMVYAYKQVFQTQAYGRMGAFAVIIFILLFAATLYSLRITRITKGAYE